MRERGLITLKYFAILVGCDYTTVDGVGATKAITILNNLAEQLSTWDPMSSDFWESLCNQTTQVVKSANPQASDLRSAFDL